MFVCFVFKSWFLSMKSVQIIVCVFIRNGSSNFKMVYELKKGKTQWAGPFKYPCPGSPMAPVEHSFTLGI